MQTCPIYKKCGSCQYMTIPYPKQLQKKQEYCQKLVKESRIANMQVMPTKGMEIPFYYRNKIIIGFNSKYEYGFYEENSHTIIPYQRCLLHEEVSDQIIIKIQSLLKRYRVSIYDERRHTGLLRHVLIRRAVKTDQTMVVLVCNDTVFKGSKNFCQELVKQFPSIKTIVLNVNKRKTSIVLGTEEKVLYGKGFIVDTLCGLHFKISSTSFYQINHQQCEALYTKAISLLPLTGKEVVIDAYCGIGTIGMVVAKSVKQVIGVEQNKEAIKDAKTNASKNGVQNISFVCDDASVFMHNLAIQKQKVDVVIMDPPRAGSTNQFMDAVKTLSPKYIIYISCDPSTQVRDLQYFQKIGYQSDTMYPYDLFPFTKHCETVVKLTHQK